MTQTQQVATPFQSICLIGLGLIGGSFAKLIRHQLPKTHLMAFDKLPVLEQAKSDGVIDKALTDLTDPQLYETDLIVLGTHLYPSYEILKTITQHTSVPLRMMDLGSTKSGICQIADNLPTHFSFIGGHPLGGKEVSGYENSHWNLFVGKRFLLTPCNKTPDEFKHQIEAWLTQLQMQPVFLDYQQHDALMSMVSHFPQFYAVALANLLKQNAPEEALKFLGGGIDDQMRLMASPYSVWEGIFQENKENLNNILSQFIAILTQMQQDLANNQLESWFHGSHETYQLYQHYKQSPFPVGKNEPF